MRRLSCLLLAAGISVLASAQDLSQKITYSSPAASVAKELEEIGKQAKLTLATTPDIADDIVVLKVKDMPLSVLMAKLSEVTSGAWVKEATGYRLVGDMAVRRQEANQSMAERSKHISEAIKKMGEPLDKMPQFTTASAGDGAVKGTATIGTGGGGLMFGAGGNSPAERAIVRFLRSIGPGPFAAMEAGDRLVFASNPNRSQSPLPNGATSAINALVQEQKVFADAAAKAKKNEKAGDPTEDNETAQQVKTMFGIDTDAMSKPLDGPPAKVLLTASREAVLGNVTITLVLYDTNGKVLLTGRQDLAVGGGLFDMDAMVAAQAELTKPPVKKVAEAVPDKEIVLSPLSKEMNAVHHVNGMNAGSIEAKIPDDLKAAMLHPDDRDPLSFAESEASMALADSKGEQLVAELPESLLQLNFGQGEGKFTVKAFAERLKSIATLSEADGVLTIKPSDPYGNRNSRVDRRSLARFIQAVNGREFAGLDDLAQYALKNPPVTSTPAASNYFLVFAPDAFQSGLGGRADWNMLRLFATLPVTQRNSLAQGGSLSLGNMAPQQIGYATKILFGADAHLQIQDKNAKPSELPSFMEMAISMFRMPTDYRNEPTEAMPNGFPRGGTLTLDLKVEPVAKSTSQGMMGMVSLGLDELALFSWMKNEPMFAASNQYLPNLNELRLGSRDIYNFTFHVSPEVTAAETLMDNKLDKNSPTVSMSNLPDDMKKKMDERVAAIKKLPFFSPAMFGRGTATPP